MFKAIFLNYFIDIDLKYMCDAYETFEELIEDEEDPKQLLENLKSKSTNLLLFHWNTIFIY